MTILNYRNIELLLSIGAVPITNLQNVSRECSHKEGKGDSQYSIAKGWKNYENSSM